MPVSIPNLEPMMSIPYEGQLRIHNPETGQTTDAWSPTGDLTSSFSAYDPESHRLYVWGFSENGWIEVLHAGESWLFGERSKITPRLYNPKHDIEDVVPVRMNEALGSLFYHGYTAPHWLTGTQSYRFFQINGTDMRRIKIAEDKILTYFRDDPTTGMAIFCAASRK